MPPNSIEQALAAGVLNLRQMDGVPITYQPRGRDGELVGPEVPIASAGWIDRSGQGYQTESSRRFPFAADVQIAKTDLDDIANEEWDTIEDAQGQVWNIMAVNGRDPSATYLHLMVARMRKTSTRANQTQRETRQPGPRNP